MFRALVMTIPMVRCVCHVHYCPGLRELSRSDQLDNPATSDDTRLTSPPSSTSQPQEESVTLTQPTIISGSVNEEDARLKGTLNKLMNGLDNRRQANTRPGDLYVSRMYSQ